MSLLQVVFVLIRNILADRTELAAENLEPEGRRGSVALGVFRTEEMAREPTESPTLKLLREAAGGSRRAAEDLLSLLYGELRRLARAGHASW